MRIETERLLIRPPDQGDLPSSRAIWSDPRVRRYLPGPFSEEQFLRVFMEDLDRTFTDYGFRSVVERSSGVHVGDVGLIEKTVEGAPEVELVYFFNADHWGRGLATEAAQALLGYAASLDLPRVVALVHPDNDPSARVASRVGMRYERDVVTDSGNPRRMFACSPRDIGGASSGT